MRIAVGGIHIECSTYNPVLNTESDFRVVKDDQLLENAYFAFLKDFPATFIPLLHARAIAGGPVSRHCYQSFKHDFLTRLKQSLPVDGVYLAMHGAMFVETMEDAEGDWISAVRDIVGQDCPISVSYDLHGNMSQKILDQIDMFSTYRTAPHIDIEQTMRRSVTMLVNSLSSGVRPALLWCPVPALFSGEQSSTEDEPAKSLYARLPEIDQIDGIWDSSLLVGYVWADEPRSTAAVVMTGTDTTALEKQAKQLAQAYWNLREAFQFGCQCGSVKECVQWAINSPTHPVILADSGDNPTGGGVGDRADLLAELLAQKATNTLIAGLADAHATQMAFTAGVGVELNVSIGGTLDSSSSPVTTKARVLRLIDADETTPRQAILEIQGLQVVVAERRRPYHYLDDFKTLGVDIHQLSILVVKSGYLSPELAPIANPNLMALSEGVVDQYIERLERHRKTHPTFPFDRDFNYQPTIYYSIRTPKKA